MTVVIRILFFRGHGKFQSKRINSENASDREFPYMVSLRRDGIHFCGGAIISSRHILTAAHCFVGRADPPYTRNLTVVSGAVEKRYGQVHNVFKVTVHSNFTRGSEARWRDDIAVVTVREKIIFDQRQSSILLPKEDTPGNVKAVLTGWGQLSSTDLVEPSVLQKRNVTILKNKECNDKKNSNMLDTQVCGYDGKGTGFCNGDSGSPLVYNDEVVGIVSFSVSCGIGYPDLYTRVYHYLDFIRNAM
ncbi:hypothetical protein HCN44_000785 [Aphidius gifuensis]|uniref:Peptidase S1 domain-containing protein n=1 Tax=Aphidius gifuensis TaxID=684658 RepID=A0A835CS77_APHGI|nr:hypothetical protein HCN44_000785 [Aphidius gifuensis]